MTDPANLYPSAPNPADVLQKMVDTRQGELAYLTHSLRAGLEAIADLPEVNRLIALSPRPDLVLNDPVAIFQITSPHDWGRLTNFNANLTNFGIPIYEDKQLEGTEIIRPVIVGRRPLTTEELQLYFFLGGRGDYDAHHEFASTNGIDKQIAKDTLMETHLSNRSFMRMWLLFPDLTVFLMNSCLETNRDIRAQRKDIREEIFVAYALMSRLTDRSDRGVVAADGTIDQWHLTH